MPPLDGVKVLDFSTLLPGPMASLILAEAGATVVKVERPGSGEDMRSYAPPFGNSSVNFALLNRGKTSLALDLKNEADRAKLQPYLDTADVLIEQFRPGVMARLGLGYEQVRERNPGVVYCSITGYGQDGRRRDQAGHDLNYLAETGVLGLSTGADGAPVLPPILAADIGGGAYPAVMNILLALRQREASGAGSHIDVAMADNLFTFAYWGLGAGFATGAWPRPGGELVTGGTPRYQIYRTQDGRFLAAAPLEVRFWQNFCEVLGLPGELRDAEPATTTAAVAAIIAAQPASHWQERFAGVDACVTVVATLAEAAADPAFVERGLFARRVEAGSQGIPALPVPIAPPLRRPEPVRTSPALGDANSLQPWAMEKQHA